MKKIVSFCIVILLISCNSKVTKEDLVKLNGYWEIEKVSLPNGETKDYKVNETIDFFSLKDNKGFRQKVMPQFDGRYKTNSITEAIKVIEKENSFNIQYNTKYGKWEEKIISIEDSTLVLKNKENLEYTYKRYKPFSLK